MKKVFLFILLFCLAKISIAQYPQQQTMGTNNTIINLGATNGGAIKGNIINGLYTDTTAANATQIDFYAGAQIFTTSDTSFWVRNKTSTNTYWFRVGGAGGGATGSNWAIGGNSFIVTPVNPYIGTNTADHFQIATDATVRAYVPSGGFALGNDTTATKIMNWNPTTKAWGYSNWNNGGSGSTPTLQQTIIAGSTLTQNNTATHSGYSFQFYSEQGTKQQLIRSLADSTLGIYLRNNSSEALAHFDITGSDTSANIKGGRQTHGSAMKLSDLGIINYPYLGRYYIDSLNYTLSTTGKKILLRDTATGLVENIDPSLISGSTPTLQQVNAAGNTSSILMDYTLNLNGSMTNFSIPNKKYVDSLDGLTNLTTKGFEIATYNSTTNTFNIPKDQRVGLYLNLGKTYTRGKPLVIGSVLLGLGNSWISGAFSGGTPYMTQLGTYFGKTVYTGASVLGGDLNTLVNQSYPFGTFGNDSTTFVDITGAAAWGLMTSGQPYSGSFYYNDNPNNPQLTKTKNYIYGTYKAFIANHYLDVDTFSVNSLGDANFRAAVASDSLGTKCTVGAIGLGAFSFTKPAGKTSLVIGTYGADSTRVRQGTITVSLAGNTIFSKYYNGLNDGNKGNSLVIKAGLNYEAIVLQNLPDSAATVTVTCSGDSTRFDYVGYLKPKEKAARPLYISNIGYGSAKPLFIIPLTYIDSANQMLQNAVNDFIDYPVYIQNTNNWLDSSIHVDNPQDIHLSSSGNDSVAKAYIANLIPQSYATVNNAAWTANGTSANYLSGSVGIGESAPDSLLHNAGSFHQVGAARFDGLSDFADTTNFKPVVINTTGTGGVTNRFYKATYWPGGGGGGLTIGNAVSGGGANRLLYEDGSQNLAASASLTFDGTQIYNSVGQTANSGLRVGSLEYQSYAVNNGWIGDNIYYNGGFRYRANGSGGLFYFFGTEGQFRFAASGIAGNDPGINSIAQFKVNEDGTVAIGGEMSANIGVYTSATLVANSSKVGIGQKTFIGDITTTPTALIHIAAGTTAASSAPLKYTAGTLLSTIEPLTREANASSLYGSTVALNRYAEGGAIKDFIATVDNVGTGETDLFTYTTKASTLAADGEKLNFNIGGTFNDLTATAQLQFYFGGTNIGNTGALTVSATGGWSANIFVIRTSSTTVRALVTVTTPGASTAVYTTQTDVTGLTLSNTNIIKITGTAAGASGGNGDISAKLGTIYWNGAANN